MICVVVVIVVVYPYVQELDVTSCKTPSSNINATALFSNVSRPTALPLSSALGSYRILSLPSDQVIIRAVYLDLRSREGFRNISVFMVEITKTLLARKGGGIVACGTSDAVTKTLKIRVVLNIGWVHSNHPSLTHDMAMIDCFGLPDTPTGARAFLWYRVVDGGDLYRVESEQPYYIPTPRNTKNKTVVCMAVLYNTPPYLIEFLRYYKHLGVDHVYMVADDSIVQTAALETDGFVQEALREGFVSFSFWHKWLTNKMIFYSSQMLAYENCIYRFQGTYEYALLVDSDDHFIPRVQDQKKLDYYIERFCKVGACTFKWIEYFPDCGQDWSRLGPHGNVTNTILSNRSQEFEYHTGKSLYKLSAALDAGIHTPLKLIKGYKCSKVPSNIAYVAHIRKHRAPPGGMKFC
ncbi:hypothetical protein GBAR_LOCUS5162 [Geodia barretti]|uniref:Glycosyltransferase family 92 protein n=1 Tax=Geodia barretti TaxID=519541 RepID=A0AA35RAG5_GEOBA|nr:hypothetical protein GBAR_LOCUS5162 [Geodia barretti]